MNVTKCCFILTGFVYVGITCMQTILCKDGYRGELGELQLPPPEEISPGEKPPDPQFSSLGVFIYFFTFFQLPPQTFPVSATDTVYANNTMQCMQTIQYYAY